MNFKLQCHFGNEEQIIANPAQHQVEEAIKSLRYEEKDCEFIILESEYPINDSLFMQCMMCDEDYYLVELQLENFKNFRMYQFGTQKLDYVIQLFISYLSGQLPNLSYWKDVGGVEQDKLIEECELCDFLQGTGLIPLKCKAVPKENEIILSTTYLKSIVDYAQKQKLNHIFYRYMLGDKNSFSFFGGRSRIDADLSRVARNEINEYYDKINTIDFTKPAFLELFCLDHGVAITVRLTAPWFEDLITANEFVAELEEKYSDVLNATKEQRSSQRENIREELKTILLENAEFALCTNQNLRREFMRKFLTQPENKRFQSSFLDDTGYLDSYAVSNFADLVYALYKQSKKR
ncbi:MAG: hypothetical protein J6D30_01480 [Clostridia bacterium]|nr:hypothetical protein [Clostridia bacterium]